MNRNLKHYLPFTLIPIMVTLEDNANKLSDKQVPLVSIYFFNAFLQELERYTNYYKAIIIRKVNVQKKLL